MLGSSPHTRGARGLDHGDFQCCRIIPAYAGSTRHHPDRARPAADHPRIRGEHADPGSRTLYLEGSSPHTRGALRRRRPSSGPGRIIPAYAGSTPAPTSHFPPNRDHPRIRGEHDPLPRPARLGRGIIPAYAGSTLGNPCNTKDRRRDYTSFPLPVTHPSGGGGS